MPFEHACFISYRHVESELMRSAVDELYEGLSSEIIALSGDNLVYRDVTRLQGGHFFNKALATALCKSVCMVMVFIPPYFSKDHTYCAREYKAMQRLEEQRLQLLCEKERQYGLIIPIIFRGNDCLPKEIRLQRQCYDFSNFLLSDDRMIRHPYYASEIRKITDYINGRWKAFKNLDADPCDCCGDFMFPDEANIWQWLKEVTKYNIPFPR